MAMTQADILGRLRGEIAAGRAIFDAFCGTGITAKMAARGGADMITSHVLAYFRMQGMSSMAGYLGIGDANAITRELGERFVVNAAPDCPVMAGVLAVDPTRDMNAFVDGLVKIGYAGIMCCPTITLIDGKFRQDLEDGGMGFQREIEVLAHAAGAGVFTKAFVTTPEEGAAMVDAGVDNIIVHFGNSSGGTIGASTVMDHDASIARTSAICDAVLDKAPETILTIHGGSIETPADFAAMLADEPRIHGYVGGSSAERFPVEDAVPKAAQAFKSIRLPSA